MKKRIGFVVIPLLVILSFFYFGCQEESSAFHLVVATDSTWPPMEMMDENKEIVGFDIDLMNEIAKAANFTVEFKSTAWEGIFAGLDSGQYDAIISSVTITDERKKAYDFSDWYINAGQVLIVRSEMTNVTSLSDMEGKTVGAQIGTTGSFEVEKYENITLRTYDELGLAIEDIVNKRIDGVVADTPIAADFVLQNPNYKGKLKIATEPFTEEYYGIVVKKGNKKVLDVINSGLKKVRDAGIIEDLKKKWIQ